MSTNEPISCPGRAETIYLWLDDELSPLEQSEFKSHLAGCPTCQGLLAELQTLLARVDSLADIAPPAELTDQVMARLPQPQSTAHRLSLSQWLLFGQIIAGLSLLLITMPQLMPALREQLFWLSWPIWVDILAVETNSWTNLARQVGLWLQSQPAQLSDMTAWFQFSGGLALVVIAGLAIAWLVGNTILLKSSPHTFENSRKVNEK